MSFANFEVVVHIDGPAMVASNPFDGVLAKLWFERLIERGEFNYDYHQRLPFLDYDEEGFYHISAPSLAIRGIEVREYTKNFDKGLYGTLFPGKTLSASALNEGSGRFKSHLIDYELPYIETLRFWARGDIDFVADLLGSLRFVGKRSALGIGKVKGIKIKEIPEDLSVVNDGKLMRHVPAGSRFLEGVSEKTGRRLSRLEHAYWEKEDRVPCIFPLPVPGGIK